MILIFDSGLVRTFLRMWSFALFAGVLFDLATTESLAQLPPPNRTDVFLNDAKTQKDANKKIAEKSLRPADAKSDNLDFQADEIDVRRGENELLGKGGVLISQGGVHVQADEGKVNTVTKDGELKGHVVMSTADGSIAAESAKVNLDTEVGEFQGAEFALEPGSYQVRAERALKLSEFEFELDDSEMTTCKCEDGSRPWLISSDRCHITQEGYAHTYGSTVRFEGTPVFYAPWMTLPVKTERASGLLAPTWGGTSQNGFRWRQSLFLVLDDTSDLTVTPLVDTRSRVGGSLGYRQRFSATNEVNTRYYYSNESRRGSSLQGLNIEGISDPTIDTNRFGGFYTQNWQPGGDSDLPAQFLVDSHYTSDNLFVREIQDPELGLFTTNYLTSTAVLRGVAFSQVNAEARVEYTQLLQGLQESQPQRIPEFVLSNTQTFRPLGFNQYGLKLVASTTADATDFQRDLGGAGWRYGVRPKLAVPFHVSNYVRGQFAAELNQLEYNLSDTSNGDGVPPLKSSNSFAVPVFGFGLRSGVERVYDLEKGNWLSSIADIGADSSDTKLTRLKHTIEPTVQYAYVPEVTQDDLPIFDSNDRYRQRSLVTYGVTSRLFGRMLRPFERSRDVGELAAEAETLPMYDLSTSVLQFGRGSLLAPVKNIDPRPGEVRELASVSLMQSYNYNRYTDPAALTPTDPLSDLALGFTVSPSVYFTTGLQSNFTTQDNRFSSFAMSAGIRDDREDVARLRYSFLDGSASQVEGNLEAKIAEQLRVGYYARYDIRESQMFESRGLLRFINSCRCWSVDLGVGSQLNPDNRQFLLTFTFMGLGDINQSVGLSPQQSQQQQQQQP